MKSLVFSFLFFLPIFLVVQDESASWFTDLSEAKTAAKSTERSIIMVFAGSDWCRPCMQLKHEVLEHEKFNAFSSSELVVLYLDFPAKKKNKLSKEQTLHNEKLAARYNVEGAFPKIVILDKDGQTKGSLKYKGQDVEGFINACKKIIGS